MVRARPFTVFLAKRPLAFLRLRLVSLALLRFVHRIVDDRLSAGAIGLRNSRGIGGIGAGSPGSSGFVTSGVTITINSVRFFRSSRLLNSVAKQRNTGQAGNLGHRFLHTIVDQSADDKTLAGAQFHIRFHSPGGQSGNEEARHGDSVCEVDRGDFGLDVHLDRAVLGHYGVERQPDAELAELNRYRAGVAAALQDRDGELTADEEAGFFAVGGDQIRFGENLQDAFDLQCLDRRGKVEIGTEREYVERVGQSERRSRPLPI